LLTLYPASVTLDFLVGCPHVGGVAEETVVYLFLLS